MLINENVIALKGKYAPNLKVLVSTIIMWLECFIISLYSLSSSRTHPSFMESEEKLPYTQQGATGPVLSQVGQVHTQTHTHTHTHRISLML
jgi:hypothetical protein